MQNHQLIRDYLLDFFQQGLEVRLSWVVTGFITSDEFFQSCPNSHSESLKKLLNVDVIGLCAHLAIIVTDGGKYKDVISRRGPDAQSLINLLQAVCLQVNLCWVPL